MKSLSNQILDLQKEFGNISELKYRLQTWYANIINPFWYVYITIKTFLYWGWKLKNHGDWDYSEIYEILQLKLERMYSIVCENPNRYPNKTLARKMKIAIGCLRSLNNTETRSRADDFVNSHPEILWRPGRHSSDKRAKLLMKTYMKLVAIEENQRKANLELFCKIFIKESKKWWN